jgi:hypothetical protein
MEQDKPFELQCDCGLGQIIVAPGHYYYQCLKCETRYFLLYVPFDVFNNYDRHLLRRKAPKMRAICSEVAAKRLMAYWDRSFIDKVSIEYLQKQGCVDIHTICKCLNYTSKTPGYQLFYRRPITIQVEGKRQFTPLTSQEVTPFLQVYLRTIFEPLIVSVIPLRNWQKLMDTLHATGKNFMDLLYQALHTIMIVGFSITKAEQVRLHVHNHISNIPIEKQYPYQLALPEQFIPIHTLADFRMIIHALRVEAVPDLYKTIETFYHPYP